MREAPTSQGARPAGSAQFVTTHWSEIVAARDEGSPDAARALESLCAAYWFPLYAWLRRQGRTVQDAEDLTQAFFGHLLSKERLKQAERARGRFRSFLIASMKNFVCNEWDKETAQKRGGQVQFVPLATDVAEERLGREPTDATNPELAFERLWAATLLEGAIRRLRVEYARDGKGAMLDLLRTHLSGDRGGVPYAEIQARLGLGESAVKMAVLRLRRRFGEILREEVARTVAGPHEIDAEIRALFAAVSR